MKTHQDWPKLPTHRIETIIRNGNIVGLRRVRGKARRPVIHRPTLRQIAVRVRALNRVERAEIRYARKKGVTIEKGSLFKPQREALTKYIQSFAA